MVLNRSILRHIYVVPDFPDAMVNGSHLPVVLAEVIRDSWIFILSISFILSLIEGLIHRLALNWYSILWL